MSYFIADEKTMEAGLPTSPTILPKQRDVSKPSNYGVESLETTINSLSHDSDDSEELVSKARRKWKRTLGRRGSKRSAEDLADAALPVLDLSCDVTRDTSLLHQRRPSQVSISRPYTPLSFGSPAPPSIISSPSSRRSSNAASYIDDTTSQAIMSSGEEDRDIGSEMIDSGSAPQLVMPSIKMPSRRPFTEKGKNMGRMKLLIAGDSGEPTAFLGGVVD
jgi:hypothetical protein